MKKITLPDGTKTNVPQRFAYKFCVAIKTGGVWITSWALSQRAADDTVAMWKNSGAKGLEFKVMPV